MFSCQPHADRLLPSRGQRRWLRVERSAFQRQSATAGNVDAAIRWGRIIDDIVERHLERSVLQRIVVDLLLVLVSMLLVAAVVVVCCWRIDGIWLLYVFAAAAVRTR